jgi:alanine-synthesizing transaminase
MRWVWDAKESRRPRERQANWASYLCYRHVSPMFSRRTDWQLTPNRLTQALAEVRASGAQLFDLTISNPTLVGLRYDAETILNSFRNSDSLRYDPQPKGLLSARQEIARYYQRDHQVSLDPEQIVLTTSTSEAYAYVFRLLCNAGDEILVPKPSYPLFDFLGDLQDVRLVSYSLEYADGWFIDFPSLVRKITPQTRAILLVHPNNPTGSYLREEEIQRLNDLCRERNLALVVDEVFLDFPFAGKAAKSFAGNLETLTFTLSGLSKISALPQMKIAWMVTSGPATLTTPALERLEVIADTFLSLSAPAQHALPVLLEQRHSIQPQILQRVHQNRASLQGSFATQTACNLLHADAGWAAVLRTSTGISDEDLAIKLLREHHVLVHPGHFYDFASDGFIVLSLLTPLPEFREGVQRLLSMF